MMRLFFVTFLVVIFGVCFGQEKKSVNTKKGELSFGVRSTGSVFTASGSNVGIGTGWQVRYRIAESLNSEWFADWISTDISGLGSRIDAHIGESMLLYPFSQPGAKNKVTPYILGGFCGDYTKIQSNSNLISSEDRWSFATQLGLGSHYNFTDRFDMSFTAQYILHFGNDLHTEIEQDDLGNSILQIHQETGGSLEGHVFLSLSANFIVFDLLKSK